ncbi:MAG: hypothetical protein ABFR75_09920 [Acidobacteriota bacterium]
MDNAKNIIKVKYLKYFLIVLTIILFLFLYTPSIFFFFRDSNQGHQLAKAQQILHGFHPFVDLLGNIYGPLVFYLSTLGQIFSNNRLIGEVVIIFLGYVSAYFLLYYLMEEISENSAISYILLLISLIFLPKFYKYYIVLVPFIVIFSIWRLFFKRTDNIGILFLGVSTGISILFRFDFGVYSFILGLLTVYFLFKDKDLKIIKRSYIIYIFSVFITGLPFLIFLILNNSFPGAIIDTFNVVKGMSKGMDLLVPVFNFNGSFFSEYNNISLFFWFFRIFPYFILALLFFIRKRLEEKEKFFILLVSLFAIMVFIQALNRPHIYHTLQAIPIQFVLVSWLFRLAGKRIIKKSVITAILVVISILILNILIPFIINNNLVRKFNNNLNVGISNYNQFFLSKKELRKKYFKKNGLLKITEFINKNTENDESVLFIPIAPQMNYFAERIFKTSLGVLGMGRLTTKEKELKFYKELEDTKTNVIVDLFQFNLDQIPERNVRYFYPNLSKLIYSNYKIVKKFGNVLLLCRDDRFDDSIIKKLLSFKKMKFDVNSFTEKKIDIKVNRINTWPVNKIKQINIPENGVLFCETDLKNQSLRIKYFIGLLKGQDLYFTRVKVWKRKKKKELRSMVFSATSVVPKGEYELIAFSRAEETIWGYHKIPVKVLIKK